MNTKKDSLAPLLKIKTLQEYLAQTETILFARGKQPELNINSLSVLNRKIWGLKRREMVIIGARTSQGKSAFALQLAWDMAKNKKKTLFLSLEMGVHAILERIFCFEYEINNIELLHGKYKESIIYQANWKSFIEKISALPIQIIDCLGKNWEEVDSLINELKDKPDLLFIDHINQTISNSDSKKTIDDYLIKIHGLGIHHNFCTVICAQVNRSSFDKDNKSREPELHHLKGSGNIEEIADVVMLLHWPYKYNPIKPVDDYKIIVAKNRNGRTGHINVKFNPAIYKFSDAVDEDKPDNKIQERDWDD